MYKILIVWALSAEINTIKQQIKKLELINIKTSFLTVWIGNYNMILNLTKFLENNTFDLILNIWVCWYKKKKEKFIQIIRIKNLSNNKELIVPNIIDFGKLESICSSEKIIYDNEKLWDENFIDMESYWFETVCNDYSIPRVILKIPVDKIWKETDNFNFVKAKKYLKLNIDYKLLFEKIENYLQNLKNNEIWKKIKEKIINNYKWSFSEKIILEKLINKYIILELGNIDLFFKKNTKCQNGKDLSKKEFLKKLEW